MTLTLKGIFKSLQKMFTKKFVVKEKEKEKEREIEIGYPTNVLHVAHVGWVDSSEGGPSWMNDYKRAPNFSKTFGTLGELRDPKPEAETSSRSSPGSQPSPGAVQVPKKHKQKKIKSSRQSKASKSKSNNEREVTPVA